jgi:hypothetical protein
MNNSELEKKVKKFSSELANEKGYICSVDVLMKLGYLSEKDHQDWRFGKVEYLEKICQTNLHKLTAINKLIKRFATEWNFEKSWTYYHRWGKGSKTKLIFSKTQDPYIENEYAVHYLDKDRIIVLKELKKTSPNTTNTQHGQ